MISPRYITILLATAVAAIIPAAAEDVDTLIKESKRGDATASLELAQRYFDEYDYESAGEYLERYRTQISRGRNKQADRSGDLSERIDLMETMMSAVENIQVIDSLTVDRDLFFEHYGLTPDAGQLLPPSTLPQGFAAVRQTAVFTPQSGRNLIWGAPVKHEGDSLPGIDLYTTWRLFGDDLESPTLLSDNLAQGGNANWPFMLSDGVTLYYASDGEGSLGGYDIFMTKRSDDGTFYEPQSMGMPYNSPYDDYMLAIDETLGIGWWATDRNRIPGKVTIYVYVTEPVRNNIADLDEDAMAGRARLSSIAATWRDGNDYADLRRAARQRVTDNGQQNVRQMAVPENMALTMPDGSVCRSVDQLRSAESRRSWSEYVSLCASLAEELGRLDEMRRRYAGGDRSLAQRIVSAEQSVERTRSQMTAAANNVIRYEKGR